MCCVICSFADARGLTTVTLGDGSHAIVCGSHALMVTRRTPVPASLDVLRATFGDRRRRQDRRDHLYQCETARMLADAFTLNRRTGRERRVTG